MMLIAMRHGETDLNVARVFQGALDEPLNAIGLAQAKAAATTVAEMEPEVIVSSGLQRAFATAQEVAALVGVPVLRHEGLNEIDCGSWAGRPYAEVEREYADLIHAGTDFRRSPEGETEQEVAHRVANALEEIVAEHDGRTVLVVGHGFALRTGIGRFVSRGRDMARWLGSISNCHRVLVEVSRSRRRISGYNLAP